MKTQAFKHTNRIIIDPGEFYVSNKGEVISTLLGSCVAACLFDPVNKVIGMNHFLLSYKKQRNNIPIIESNAGRYGLNAMELLINEMMDKGANRFKLQAKCFGGADVLHINNDSKNHKSVGSVNMEFIEAFLKEERIPIVGSDLGGSLGRNIHFVGSDYSVFVKMIGRTQEQAVKTEEQIYWDKSIKQRKKDKKDRDNKIEFW